MAVLTQEEKVAGRLFRDEQQALLDKLNGSDAPRIMPPFWLRHYRHACPSRGGVSASFALNEVYITSPDGRVAFVYKQGRCSCGLTGRTRTGRVVDAHTRKPMGRT